MKLQIAFDLVDLDKALEIAREVEEYADTFEVGTILIYKYGEESVRTFKEAFPHKHIFADSKIADRGKEAAQLFSQAGADWISIMAGVDRGIIHAATKTAHEMGKRVMLDLLDASSLGQAALEAKSLGVDALIFHSMTAEDTQGTFLERWDMVKGNTSLPVFMSGALTRDSENKILEAQPYGLVLSNTITQANNPRDEAAFFSALCQRI